VPCRDRSKWARTLEPVDVRPEASLRERGMDSLALEELRLLLEECLRIGTVGQLTTVVDEKTAA
jgi:acyl carrier protein